MCLPAALKRNLTVGVKRNNRFFSSPLIHLDCSLAFVVAKVMQIVGKEYVLLCYNFLQLWLSAGELFKQVSEECFVGVGEELL